LTAMGPTLHDLGIDKLTLDEKWAVAEALLEDLHREEEAAPITEAQRAELERRLADCIANPDAGAPWEEVEARLLARLRK